MKAKFIVLAIAGSLICSLCNAQIKKGSLLFGGSVGYSSFKQNNSSNNWTRETKRKDLTLSPSFAIAIADNLFLGAELSWYTSKEKYSPAVTENWMNYKSDSKGGGVFVRKYWKIVDKFYVFGQGGLNYYAYKQDVPPYETAQSTTYNKSRNLTASLYPGLSLALSKKIHLESIFGNLITLRYSNSKHYYKINGTKEGESDRFDVTSSFDNASLFSLGVKVLLAK